MSAIACRGRLRNLGADSSKIGLYFVTLTWQQSFTSSYASRRFAACNFWKMISVAGNAARQWLLRAISHVFYTMWKETLLQTKRIGTVVVTWGSFSLWCRQGKALCEPEQDFSVWLFRSGCFGLSRFGLAVSVTGHFGHDISVHKQFITFVYLNDYRQAKCHYSWCYTNTLWRVMIAIKS